MVLNQKKKTTRTPMLVDYPCVLYAPAHRTHEEMKTVFEELKKITQKYNVAIIFKQKEK